MHMSVHVIPQQSIWTCDYCDYSTSNERTLSYHEHAVHKQNNFKCSKCNIFFPNQESLTTHSKLHQKFRYEYTQEERSRNGYCSFWNNSVCNFGEQCKFMHENAPYCRFQINCYRKNCPFYHEQTESSNFLYKKSSIYH